MNLEQYKKARLIRDFEQLLLRLFSEGKLNGTVHTCVGQELIPTIVSEYIIDEDIFISNHRGHGHYLAKTNDIKGLLLELLGKKNGCSGGYGGSQHLFKDRSFYSNGIQGGMTPIATGIAMAKKNCKEKGILIQFIGDGTLGEGLLYESMNCAAVYELPLLIILENNGYAQSTSMKQTFGGDIQKRIEGFGFRYFKSNIWDYDDLNYKIKEAINSTRNFNPVFIEVNCYRLNSHSKGDDNRNRDEIEEYIAKDPINIFELKFPAQTNDIKNQIADLLNFHLEESLKEETLLETPETSKVYLKCCSFERIISETSSNKRLNELIFDAFKNQIEHNSQTVFLGEDIQNTSKYTPKEYGGAFKVTRNLSDLSEFVYNTPISEAAICGMGIGLSLYGVTSVVEIMFGDFTTLTFDQILQHASKFQGMYGLKLNSPFVLRTPMGGKRGYGPTHSQSLEKHFLGIYGINIVALNHRIDPRIFYEKLFGTLTEPTIVIENKTDYTRYFNSEFMVTHEYYISDDNFPVLLIKPKISKAKCTIVCYGGTLFDVEKAAFRLLMKHEIGVEILCFTQISKINIQPIIDSVNKTNKLVTIEEGSSFAGFGSEVIAQIVSNGCKVDKAMQIGNDSIIPSSYSAEINLLPNEDKIVATILNM